MRPEESGFLPEIGDRAHQLRRGRIPADVEHPDAVVRQAARPQVAAVVGESHVVRLDAGPGGDLADHLAVALRLRIDVDRDQLVGAVAQPFDAERPDVDVILLALDELRDVRRIAGLIVMCDADGADARKNEPSHDSLPGLVPRLSYTARNTFIQIGPSTDFPPVNL